MVSTAFLLPYFLEGILSNSPLDLHHSRCSLFHHFLSHPNKRFWHFMQREHAFRITFLSWSKAPHLYARFQFAQTNSDFSLKLICKNHSLYLYSPNIASCFCFRDNTSEDKQHSCTDAKTETILEGEAISL